LNPAETGSPVNDSVVVTCTPFGVSVNVHSWMPVMPFEVPPHKMQEPSSSAYTVDVISIP